jgi:serine/threonine protein phosphatase 1
MRKFVMGDIHGAYKALKQCLQISKFDYENDLLIQLGDVVDGYPQSFECVEELLKIKHLIAIKGNHDDLFGKATLSSYLNVAGKSVHLFSKGSGFKSALKLNDIPASHKAFFDSQLTYYIDDENRCFVHAGFKTDLPFSAQKTEDFYLDRSLWEQALACKNNNKQFHIKANFKEIYIGHTPTTKFDVDKPMNAFNIHNLDTGAGHSGRLTIMDLETRNFWQSDPTPDLYEVVL